jgi:hypothetical protein
MTPPAELRPDPENGADTKFMFDYDRFFLYFFALSIRFPFNWSFGR